MTMAPKWIELVTGSFEQKRQYRQHQARSAQLPEPYRTVMQAVERYLTYFGAVSDGATLVSMLSDLADLFEQAAADRTPVRNIVGDDPVEFAEAFLANYADGQWINKERRRLRSTIDQAADADNDSDGNG